MFNEIDGSHDDVAISTFKAGLPAEHDLRKSLTGRPVTSVCLLMDRIDKYRRIEEDQLQEKGKAKVIPQERRDSRSDRSQNNRPQRDFLGQSAPNNSQAINIVFREPMQKVLEKVRSKPFFKWPNKMAGDSMNRNQNLYCHYHQNHGHTTEDCRNLWDHLEQLVRDGRLKHLLHHSSGRRAEKQDFEGLLWGLIDPIYTICIEKGWAYGLIPSPRIREYPRTTSKGRDENYTLKRGKEYLCRI